jgi:hypothetical protein
MSREFARDLRGARLCPEVAIFLRTGQQELLNEHFSEA